MARPVGVTIIAILEFLGAGVFIAIGLFCLLGMSFLASLLSQMSQTRNLGGAVFTAGPEGFSERAPAAIFGLGSSFELSRFFYSCFLQMPLLVARPAKF